MTETQHATFRLAPASIDLLSDIAQRQGVSKSRILDHLLAALAAYGPERVRWPDN